MTSLAPRCFLSRKAIAMTTPTVRHPTRKFAVQHVMVVRVAAGQAREAKRTLNPVTKVGREAPLLCGGIDCRRQLPRLQKRDRREAGNPPTQPAMVSRASRSHSTAIERGQPSIGPYAPVPHRVVVWLRAGRWDSGFPIKRCAATCPHPLATSM